MTTITSPSLLLRIRDPDDQAAWEEFLSIYSVIVRDYCYQRRLQTADVDDIVQDVMASVSRSIRRFDYDPVKGRFRSWLGTVTVNCIKAHQSRSAGKSVATVPANDLVLNEKCADPDEGWVSVFSEHILRTACSHIRRDFNDRTWDCFESNWVREENALEIAKRLEIPVHSVYVNKSRVLKRLEAEVMVLAEDLPFAGNSKSETKRAN